MREPTHALVLGGGLAGMLAASVLAEHVDTVTIVERDRLPEQPEPRRGLPQAHHVHGLMAGGVNALEALLPGAVAHLVSHGARLVDVPGDVLILTERGWIPRVPGKRFALTCSRWLLDWGVRRLVLRHNRIAVLEDAKAEELVGGPTRITGARVQDGGRGCTQQINADLVVDATGRSSRAGQWLPLLGLPAPREELVDPGIAYSTRRFTPPAGLHELPPINLGYDPWRPLPFRFGALVPLENGQWLVTLTGRGVLPPGDHRGFVEFARSLPHPVIADLIALAEPAGPIRRTRSTANHRRFYEKISHWPEGFVVLGDAITTHNPVYGHGMSVAACQAMALREVLRQHGLVAGTARRIQRAVACAGRSAYQLSVIEDLVQPTVETNRSLAVWERWGRRYASRLMLRVAAGGRAATDALLDVYTLLGPLRRCASPGAVFDTLRGPGRPLHDGPPFTADELAVLGREAPRHGSAQNRCRPFHRTGDHPSDSPLAGT
ncbi:hypothetical protein GCM10012275_13370 [Longimycelium tulufanense]|uniref:Uncharacterized protein n=1 Tax=Longimycelium tulufanense TaxID=907463 RepID=A0A8J3C6T6_9PSEU|nr:hypothetical protein [Longimycelium tulufanense]GGM43702.1 hypothetical protein GCM10012275_13370 [Longimycelium tulufanense]